MGGQVFIPKKSYEDKKLEEAKTKKSNTEWQWNQYLQKQFSDNAMGRGIFAMRPRSLFWFR